MKRKTIIAAAVTAALSLGAPMAAQASTSTGCSIPRTHAFHLVHNLREHGTTCAMARNLVNFSLNGPNGYHRWIYVGSKTWTVTSRTGAPCARPWAIWTMRSGSSWITFDAWGW